MRLLCALIFALIMPPAPPAGAQALAVEALAVITDLPRPAESRHLLELRVVLLDGSWNRGEITNALGEASRILGHCGIHNTRIDLLRVTAPQAQRHFDPPHSRQLARALDLPRPTLFFTAGTRQIPAYDAVAYGRSNSRRSPELESTVWIAPGARDLGIVIAHELVHVLMDSGEHVTTPGNLMAEETAPGNTGLTAAQCGRITTTGTRHGLLRPGVD
jgi:hypothetical protein